MLRAGANHTIWNNAACDLRAALVPRHRFPLTGASPDVRSVTSLAVPLNLEPPQLLVHQLERPLDLCAVGRRVEPAART